jgi:predicted AlkP superfamily phosphohydrolase/phosphomutase
VGTGTKVLLLAIDAGDKVLIRKWAGDGTLKNFRGLLSKGLVGDVEGLEGFFEGSTWPSFYTAVTPARHGFHRLVQLKSGTYQFHRCYTGEHIAYRPFWEHLSHAGYKTCVLDVPLSGISRNLNGIQTVEWGSHDPNYGFCTRPGKLKKEVIARFGQHPMQKSCDAIERTPKDFRAFRDCLLKGVRKKTDLTNYFLMNGSWDFFAQVFTEAHCVGHQCWHLHDPSHPSYDHDTAAMVGDPINDVYVAIDKAIGEILHHVDDRTFVIVLASHRMAHNFGAQFLLPDILVKLMVAQPRAVEEVKADPIGRLDHLLTRTWHHTPVALEKAIRPIADRLRSRVHLPGSVSRLDFRRSQCFPLDNGLSVGGIRVNLIGREPYGTVRPGTEMNSFCNALIRDLLDIVDLETGDPVIKKAVMTSELYSGECLDHLPDVLVEWDDEKAIGNKGLNKGMGSKVRLASKKMGVVEGVNTYTRTGDHRAEGLFIAFGPGIKPGSMTRPVSIMDFGPTVARLLGVSLPNVDGEPVTEVF